MKQQDTAEANRQAILESPSYRLAEYDFDFLKRDEIRHVRMTLELLKTETLLRDYNVTSTIVVFGSARIVPEESAKARLDEIHRAEKTNRGDTTLRRDIDRAERLLAKSHFYEEARQFARLVSTQCQLEGRCDYVIATGGGPGIMEAANRGAFEVGAKSVGFNIDLPHEQEPNPYITPDLCFRFHYFAIRKFHFILRAKALVVFPGGFGTLDELFDTLCLRQTKRMQAIPIILYSRDYWDTVLNLPHMADEGVIDHEDLQLYHYAESPDEAWRIITDFHGVK